MKLCDFSEINDAENGQQIPSFQGKIKKVFDAKTGVGDYGPWSLQNIILQDEHANEITVTWTGDDPWRTDQEGTSWLFESGHDKKDQLCGLKKEVRTKGGKRYESVKVDNRSKIKRIDAQPMVHGTTGSSDWPEAPLGEPESPVPSQKSDDGVLEAKIHLMKACNLYNLCIDAVVATICPHVPDEQRTNEQFQSTLASIWIEASGRRSTNGVDWWSYIDKMPAVPIKK